MAKQENRISIWANNKKRPKVESFGLPFGVTTAVWSWIKLLMLQRSGINSPVEEIGSWNPMNCKVFFYIQTVVGNGIDFHQIGKSGCPVPSSFDLRCLCKRQNYPWPVEVTIENDGSFSAKLISTSNSLTPTYKVQSSTIQQVTKKTATNIKLENAPSSTQWIMHHRNLHSLHLLDGGHGERQKLACKKQTKKELPVDLVLGEQPVHFTNYPFYMGFRWFC